VFMILEYEIKVTISICSSGVEVWNSTFMLQVKYLRVLVLGYGLPESGFRV
jgi:hypothetical protein